MVQVRLNLGIDRAVEAAAPPQPDVATGLWQLGAVLILTTHSFMRQKDFAAMVRHTPCVRKSTAEIDKVCKEKSSRD